jgi:serine/threonine protein kinase
VNDRKLGKYELINRLGRGGMAEVYKAYHANLDRYVAIKIMHNFLADDPGLRGRFEREAQNIARLKHPHIVQVYDFEFDARDDSYYMVMELIEGINLKEYMATLRIQSKPLLTLEALRIIRECASALDYAHKSGMIHRDVKPANLILDQMAGNRVVLTDFGISRLLTGTQHTVTGGLVGTPAYLSPEQGGGETGDERSDLYSLGVILYEMVTGELPYHSDTPLGLILRHMNDPIPSARKQNPSLPPQVESVIGKLMAKEPVDRYQTALELINDIKRLEKELQATEDTLILGPDQENIYNVDPNTPVFNPTKPKKRTVENRRSRTPFLVTGFILLIVVILGGYVAGARSGAFTAVGFLASDTPSPTMILTPTTDIALIIEDTPTATSTSTATATHTSTPTSTATATSTPTATNTPNPPTSTRTPTITTPTLNVAPSATFNLTATLSVEQTATTAACLFDYAIIEQSPADGEDGGFFPVNTDYERTITLLNTGTCDWERNTSLTFITGSGESFNAGPRVFIRAAVGSGHEVDVVFRGTLPSRGSLNPITGEWQLRTPGQIAIGEPFTIGVMVYDPGR